MKPVRVHEDAELRREQLLCSSRSLDRRGRPGTTSGTISVRSGEAVVITTGDPHRDAAEQSTAMVDPVRGLPLLGETEWPPPATPVHLALHRLPGCGAVVHTDEPHSMALAALVGAACGEPAGPVFLVAPPDGPGLPEGLDLSRLADGMAVAARAGARDADAPPALLVEGTGLFTWGRDPDEALGRLERIEELGRPLLPKNACAEGTAGVRTR